MKPEGEIAGILRPVRELSQRGGRVSFVARIHGAGERYDDTFVDPAWQNRLGIADLSLRQRPLNPAPIDSLASAAAASMGKSPS